MKAKIGNIEVEGTPDEIATLLSRMPLAAYPVTQDPAQTPRSGRTFVSEEVAFRALKRRPLSDQQGAVLTKLKASYPDWTSAKDLQKVTDYTRNQLAGLFGAFGKRVAATDGYVSDSWFFDTEWSYDKGCYQYRFPPAVYSAVQRAGI